MKFYNDRPPYYVFTIICRSSYGHEKEITVIAASAEVACKMFTERYDYEFISCVQGPKALIESRIFEA